MTPIALMAQLLDDVFERVDPTTVGVLAAVALLGLVRLSALYLRNSVVLASFRCGPACSTVVIDEGLLSRRVLVTSHPVAEHPATEVGHLAWPNRW